jgi:hypothetical protein
MKARTAFIAACGLIAAAVAAQCPVHETKKGRISYIEEESDGNAFVGLGDDHHDCDMLFKGYELDYEYSWTGKRRLESGQPMTIRGETPLWQYIASRIAGRNHCDWGHKYPTETIWKARNVDLGFE